jgi:HK97 family phage prohead protease
MERAWAVFEVKAMDDEKGGKRKFAGIATTPSTDRMGDIVEPKGAEFDLPIPLLFQHDSSQPIGWVTSAKVTAKGIEVEGEIASVDEPGRLQDRLTEAWQMLKSKLVRGLSIGFNAVESARIEGSYGYRFLKWKWLELSAVTIPANQDCSITAIKRFDVAATGKKGVVYLDRPQSHPGVSGQAALRKGAVYLDHTRKAHDETPRATGGV